MQFQKIKSFAGLLCSLALTLASISAYAQTNSTTSTSATSTTLSANEGGEPASLTSIMEKEEAETPLSKRLILSYWGFLSGPSLGKVDGAYTPDSKGVAGDPINIDGVITAGYKPSKNLSLSLGAPFVYRPSAEAGTTEKDAYLKASRSNVISSGGLAMSLAARLQMPTTVGSREAGKNGSVRLEQNLTYDIPGSRFQVAAFTYLLGSSYHKESPESTAYAIYAAPYVTYQIKDKLSATAWCDLIQLSSTRNDSAHMKNAPVALQTGLSWDATENVNLNPFVNVYPENMSPDSSSVGMILSLRAL